MPPLRWASATTCMARVDLPDDSGPKISTTRPRGRPPMPRARSRASAPVGIDSMFMWRFSPIRMIEPLPNCFSICPRAMSSALSRSMSCLLLLGAVVHWTWPTVRAGCDARPPGTPATPVPGAGIPWPGHVVDCGATLTAVRHGHCRPERMFDVGSPRVPAGPPAGCSVTLMPDDDLPIPRTPDAGAPGSAGGAGGAGDTPPADPTILSRKELQTQRVGSSRTKWWVLGAIAALLVAAVAAIVLLTGSSAAKKKAAPTTQTTTAPVPVAPTCPLTGTPAPGGVVPARPALATKIGNYTDDRPSSGLNQADIVFEEPVEGSYTRLVAVFQCQGAALVGDLRSARQPDVAILSQLSNPLFVHAGGINPVLALLAGAPIQDKNVLNNGFGSVTIHPSGRYAPYSTFTATTPVAALAPRGGVG